MRRRLGWGKAINEELKEKGTLKEHGVIRKISIFLTVLPETNENHGFFFFFFSHVKVVNSLL